MKSHKAAVVRIATLSFLGALAFYVFLNNVLIDAVLSSWLKLVIGLLSSFGIYEIVFELSFTLYTRYFYRIFERRYNFDGEWHQIFSVNESNEIQQRIRQGPVRISSTFEKISISAENYSLDGTFRSSWQSESAIIEEDKITLSYVSESVSRQNSISRGIMTLHIYGNPPARFVGSYADAAPATHSGSISIFRDKCEYNKKLEELMQSSGSSKEEGN